LSALRPGRFEPNNYRYTLSRRLCEPYGRPGRCGGKSVGVLLAALSDLNLC